MGSIDAEGYLTVRDREGDVIRIARGPVYPSEVEAALLTCANVGDATVLGLPGEAGHEIVLRLRNAGREPHPFGRHALERGSF